MRKLIISILLASAATSPALAQDRPDRDRHDQSQADREQAHEERQQAREARQQVQQEERVQGRAERFSGASRPEARPERPAVQVEAREQVQSESRGGSDRSRFEHRDRVTGEAEGLQQQQREQRVERRREGFAGAQEQQAGQQRNWNRDRADWSRQGGDLRRSDRAVPNVMRTRNPLVVSNTPREGTQPPLRTQSRRYSGSNWSTNWRHNDRYNWRDYRNRHRSTFHVGLYYDPFGWNYRPYQIGWRLWPSYYSNRYLINDPYSYRLPYAPPGTTWVRYWNDAILVDTFSGEVIDVIRDFFW
jgi:hypothetical protein